MDKDRRKQPRIDLIYFSRVVDRQNGELIGYLSDLSTGGAMMISTKPLDVGTQLQIRIDLPEGYPKPSLDLNARIVWCTPDNDPDTYRSGLLLLNITPLEMSWLDQILVEFGWQG
jgi:hypothetical protein